MDLQEVSTSKSPAPKLLSATNPLYAVQQNNDRQKKLSAYAVRAPK